MTYPAAPDASSPEPFGFWWNYDTPYHTRDVCATDGAGFLRAARAGAGLAEAPVWDAALSQALIDTAADLDAATPGAGWNAVRAALVAEAASPGPTATRFAVYLAFYRGYGRLDAIRIPANTVYPRLGQTVVAPPNSGLYACWVPGADAPPHGDVGGYLDTILSESRYGWRVHPGEAVPQLLPHPAPARSGGGASATVALVALGGLLVIAAGVAALNHTAAAYAPRARTSRRRR